MRDAIGLGLTHFPLWVGTDANMAALLRGTLNDPDIPVQAKDPASWPERMRTEWSDDRGARTQPPARGRSAVDQ